LFDWLQDLILMMLDATKGDTQRALLEKELHEVGLRLNGSPPDITYKVRPAAISTITTATVCASLF
jgi:ribosome-interacting GTPase 1